MPNYIYALRCPIEDEIRYIGKTNNPTARLISHIVSARKGDKNHWAAKWIRKVLRNGLKPVLEILEELDESENWEEYERFYIENGEYFGWRLTNSTPGGEGGGYIRPEDKETWRKNVHASLQRPEVRQRISEGVKAHSTNPELKSAQSERFKAKWLDPSYRDRMKAISAIVNADPAVRESRSVQGKKRMENQEERKKISDGLLAFYATPEGRANKTEVSNRSEKVEASREGQIKNWQDPAYRERQLAAMGAPESVEKIRTAAKNQWADPTIRAKMVEANKVAQQARRARNARTPKQEIVWREERLAKRREKRAAQKAAKLAATTSAPYTESS